MLEDRDFIKSCDVPGPTKEAIRAIIIYKSGVTSDDKVIDCGCGTGGITCEFSQRAREVIAIDTNRRHHEIYLSDPRKTSADKLKTVIRYPIR